ncbi:MAG: Fur family transcriptional regulator [Magnetospirillum sp.]|nr:Fur family transcriptional regulator [Magnetospirillum sp.]
MSSSTPHLHIADHDHAKCVAGALAAARDVCAQRGERFTELRGRVLELVWESHRPIGAYAILERLRADGRSAAPPTVYRALDFLMSVGLVHRIESLNAYIGCAHPGQRHASQFLICTDCGTAVELDDPAVAGALAHAAEKRGFKVEARVVELSGHCASCAQG